MLTFWPTRTERVCVCYPPCNSPACLELRRLLHPSSVPPRVWPRSTSAREAASPSSQLLCVTIGRVHGGVAGSCPCRVASSGCWNEVIDLLCGLRHRRSTLATATASPPPWFIAGAPVHACRVACDGAGSHLWQPAATAPSHTGLYREAAVALPCRLGRCRLPNHPALAMWQNVNNVVRLPLRPVLLLHPRDRRSGSGCATGYKDI